MGVPAFYRWLSEKYPKTVTDVLEERTQLSPESNRAIPPDASQPNPSGLECDNLYIDMNGIIHPCSHPEQGPQPSSEVEMYENVTRYVDRLFRAARPRKLLFLAIDGVAPRAKMNQQRARRFKSAQEVRERMEIEASVAQVMKDADLPTPADAGAKPWDSNVITPGTKFMLNLSDYLRFYIRKRISEDEAWAKIKVMFSDASVPGEGEHKIMAHVRRQRAQPGYDPNIVHILHGLDADLIMLALATHEAHFYILREEVVFGRKGLEALEKRRNDSGFTDAQRQLDELASGAAMDLLENRHKPLQRLSVPVLREYLQGEFKCCENVPFEGEVSFERVVDDFVFLCFFVGNDFLPHLPSLDIRDGALDFLLNVYKRVLPSLGDYITDHGGNVNLSNVDVILSEVGSIEDHVFGIRHAREQEEKDRRARFDQLRKGRGRGPPPPPITHAVKGKAARALERAQNRKNGTAPPGEENETPADDAGAVAIRRKISATENLMTRKKQKRNDSTALAINGDAKEEQSAKEDETEWVDTEKPPPQTQDDKKDGKDDDKDDDKGDDKNDTKGDDVKDEAVSDNQNEKGSNGSNNNNSEATDTEYDSMSQEDEESELDETKLALEQAAAKKALKEKVKAEEQKKLDKFTLEVKDNVRFHDSGWKDRYYTDKCKAEDIEGHGGREELFRSYVMGLAWVMKYYYAGVCSWKWYFPFHYAPFASDLKNIERFDSDVKDGFVLSVPFTPVEQLLSVLPDDSSHAVPEASRWLMGEDESPIIDFYPKEVPCDPNGKAMPWLWVVLLPFISEERLLDAMKPTMEKWTKQELLCNSRGLDDAYLYVHSAHPLYQTMADIIAKDKKRSLGDSARWSGFTGTVRRPLSNELFDEIETRVEPPPLVTRGQETHDGLISAIRKNKCVCTSFSEPMKLQHKSIMLHGAIPPPDILTEHDLRIRKPRLNRGGQSISNLGTTPWNPNARHSYGGKGGGDRNYNHNGEGNNAGFNNRGHHSNGMRPHFNNHNGPPPPHFDNRTQQFHGGAPPPNGMPPPPIGFNRWQPPPPPGQTQWGGNGNGSGGYNNQSYKGADFGHQAHQHGQQNVQNLSGMQRHSQPPPPPPYQQQQYQQPFSHQRGGGGGGRHQSYQQPPPRGGHSQGRGGGSSFPQNQAGQSGGGGNSQPQNQGTSSYSFTRQGGQQQRNRNQQQEQPRVNPNLMNSLRSQLQSTLQQNRRGNNR